jgi:hypothetical protein
MNTTNILLRNGFVDVPRGVYYNPIDVNYYYLKAEVSY